MKYESYVESLRAAMSLRLKKRGDKELERALVVADPENGASLGKGRWKGHPEEETIEEADEPPLTPGGAQRDTQHHRESAGVTEDR